jgi:hypothetical protein
MTGISSGGQAMRILLSGAAFLVASMTALPSAHGQNATEQFIPLGQSPGASGTLTSIGEIGETDARGQTLSLVEASGSRTVKITEKTRIFLDRSKLKQTNVTGTYADLKKGRRVEVKYEDPASKQTADWIKVEITQP